MKKVGIAIIILLIFTGCGTKSNKIKEENKQGIIGTWITKYELSVFGETTETYIFKKDNKCVRILNAGNDITNNCTYELNEDKTKIRIIWDDKIDKESYSKYVEIDDNKILIGEHTFERKVK